METCWDREQGREEKSLKEKLKADLKSIKGADLIPLFTRAFFQAISRALPCPEGSLL